MPNRIWPVDAVAGSPLYSGRALRQTQLAPLVAGARTGRPLGGRSGVRPGTPTTTVTATSTTWTCGPHGGILDLQAAAEAGPYGYAIDTAVSGAMTAANQTNPRIDIVYVQLDDPAEGDGTSAPAATPKYLAGNAGQQPSAPAAPARSMVLAQINVPASGGGAPSVTWVAPYAVAAGGITPVRALPSTVWGSPDAAEFVDLGGVLYRGDGTTWAPVAGAGPWSDTVLTGGFTQSDPLRFRFLGTEVETAGTYLVRTQTSMAINAGAQFLFVAAGAIPPQYRPATAVRYPGLIRYTAAPGLCEILILPDGSVGAVASGSGTLPVGTYGITMPRHAWPRAQ